MHRAAVLHVLHNIGTLAFIRSDHANLFRLNTSTEKSSCNFFNGSSLGSRRQDYNGETLNVRIYVYCFLRTEVNVAVGVLTC